MSGRDIVQAWREWKRRRHWTPARQVEHLRTMLADDHRWLVTDKTSYTLTERYLAALTPDWYRRHHEHSSKLRSRLGVVPPDEYKAPGFQRSIPLPENHEKTTMNVNKHLNLLGLTVEDRVTGFRGVVASVSFDLYGCVQAVVNPRTDKDGKLQDQTWFDIARLAVLDAEPVMERPNFESGPQAEGKKGAAAKPPIMKA